MDFDIGSITTRAREEAECAARDAEVYGVTTDQEGAAEEANGIAFGLNSVEDSVGEDIQWAEDAALRDEGCEPETRACYPQPERCSTENADCVEDPALHERQRQAMEAQLKDEAQNRCIAARTNDFQTCMVRNEKIAVGYCEQGLLPNGQEVPTDPQSKWACERVWREGIHAEGTSKSSSSSWSLGLSLQSPIAGIQGGYESGRGKEEGQTSNPSLGYTQKCMENAVARADRECE